MTTSDGSSAKPSAVPTASSPSEPPAAGPARPPVAQASLAQPPVAQPFDLDAPVSEADEPVFESRTLRSFVRNGRLVRIPARERKRRVILRWLIDEVLPDDEPVQERELNMRIALRHADSAALRRYLVDSKLAERHGMVYRRLIPVRAEP